MGSRLRILLDTHTFLWLVQDRERIASVALAELDGAENQVFYSAVASWEIAAKRAKGKLHFSGSPIAVARKFGLDELPISSVHSEFAAELPPHHFDPFDRLLIAQAVTDGLVLATRDPAMARYGIRVLKV